MLILSIKRGNPSPIPMRNINSLVFQSLILNREIAVGSRPITALMFRQSIPPKKDRVNGFLVFIISTIEKMQPQFDFKKI